MYYKLPIKDRMDLMKSYKKANPKMSYSDMVNDYNDTYQKFGNGGEKEREPIITNDKNDPRLKAYNDSLSSYQWNKKAFDKVISTGKSVKGSDVDVKNYQKHSKEDQLNLDYKNYIKWGLNITKKDVDDELAEADPYNKGTKKLDRAISYVEFPIKSGGVYRLAQYKKPVQPYIYKKPEEKKQSRTDVYTDKALFNKAYKAETDSSNAYNNYKNKIKGWVPANTVKNEDKVKDFIKNGQNLKDAYYNKSENAITYFPTKPKKPVVHNVYEPPLPEPKVEPKKELPKKEVPISKSDTLNRRWNFERGENPTMQYFDKTNKLIKEEAYDNTGPNRKLIEPIVKKFSNGGIQRFDDGGKKGVPTADNTNVARSYFPNPDNTNMDTRRIPQSGMVVDKRTNQAYYFGDDGDTGTFPVLTAKNPEANKNTYSLSQLAKNSNLRSTPKGYYMVEKESKYKSKDDMQHYKGLMRSLNPIEAYGESKPSASDLALHLTFTDPGNPKVFKNREHLYNEVPQKRYASYGCVNCQEPSYRAFNKAVPESDTLMMLDSKDPKDLRLLKQAQSRIKTKIKD